MSYKESFLREAIALAQEGKETKGGGAFGALITKNDKIISSCYNLVGASNDPTQHAELRCIQKAAQVLKTKDLSDCELYTSCVPCMMCLGAVKWAQFKNVYYGATAQMAKDAGYIYSDMYYARPEDLRDYEFNMHQHLSEEAAAVWKDLK